MKLKLKELEEQISNKILREGFEIEYIEFVKELSNNVLRIVIDKKQNDVSINDCEKISRLIEQDVDKYIDIEYVLEVSSAGLERQLKNVKLFQKYQGKEILVKLYKKCEYGKELTGVLEKINEKDDSIVLNINNQEIEINIKDIANAHTIFDFSKAFKNKDNVNINELKKF